MTYRFMRKLQQSLLVWPAVIVVTMLSACETSLDGATASPSGNNHIVARVGFENSAYSVGDAYDATAQAADWTVRGKPTRMTAQTTVITDNQSHNGRRALAVRYAPNVQAVKQVAWSLPPRQSYTLSYALRFEEGFVFNGQGKTEDKHNGGKLPGLAGRGVKGYLCTGGMDCQNGGGFTARLMWRTDGQAVLYLYDHQKSVDGRKYGLDIPFKTHTHFRPGKWHHIKQTVTVNDPERANGSIDIWMDGQKVVSLSGRQLVTQSELVDTVLFSTFFGGNALSWFPATEQTAYFDDFIVTR